MPERIYKAWDWFMTFMANLSTLDVILVSAVAVIVGYHLVHVAIALFPSRRQKKDYDDIFRQ